MPTVSEILKHHVTLDIESVDRMYLNGYVPDLQTGGQLAKFFVTHRGCPVPSPALLRQMTTGYVKAVESLMEADDIPVVAFKSSDDKDAIGNRMRAKHPQRDAVVFIGVAQEKAASFKGHKKPGPWVNYEWSRQPVYVKHYYFYIDDEDFGPVILKVCTYMPFPIKLIINGHEWAKRQLDKRGVGYESLDNGFLSCQAPEVLQALCNQFGPAQIEALFRKWLERLPCPLTTHDGEGGYRHELSVWQVEFSRTQVFQRPVRGRQFFEDVIRENLDLGRPERIQLLFERRIQRNTPGTFRTRIITDGVQPSLHVSYKSTEVKQYFKDNRALRTETTINRAEDVGVQRRLENLPYLIQIARHATHRLLEVEKVSDNCVLSYASVHRLTQPTDTDDGHRAPSLKIDDPRVMCLFGALCLFLHLIDGFRNRDLRKHVAHLMGVDEQEYTAGQMTYDLRRLRLKGIIHRVPGTTLYRLTPYGWKVAVFVTRVHARLLRPGFAAIEATPGSQAPLPLRQALARVDKEIDQMVDRARLDAVENNKRSKAS
jgi:hypothetical protein